MSAATLSTPTVSPKYVLRDALDRIPDDATYSMIMEELNLLAALEESSLQDEKGLFMTQEEFNNRERPWLTKKSSQANLSKDADQAVVVLSQNRLA